MSAVDHKSLPDGAMAVESPKNETEKGRIGCHNRRPVEQFPPYIAQDGWKDGKRREVVVKTSWNPMGCGHSERASDDRCGDCHWRHA